MVEAAQVAGEVVSRSRVGLCDRAARQGAVLPAKRLHSPTVPLCTLRGEPSVHHRLAKCRAISPWTKAVQQLSSFLSYLSLFLHSNSLKLVKRFVLPASCAAPPAPCCLLRLIYCFLPLRPRLDSPLNGRCILEVSVWHGRV